MGIDVSYKIDGTCPPFTVILSGTTCSSICSQIIGQTGCTLSMCNLNYSTPYALCVNDGDYLGDPWVCSFTTPATPSVVSVVCTGSSIGSNQCCRRGNISISPSISGSYTGETSICYCNQITGTPPVFGISRTSLYRNNILFHNNLAVATGTAVDTSTTLPIIVGSGDTLTYALYSCVGSVNTNSLSAISIACTSPITLNTLNNEANMCIGSPNSQSISTYNYVPVGKTVAATRIYDVHPAPPICMACGTIVVSPALSSGQLMNIRMTADTGTVSGGLSCVKIFCCAGGVFPMFSICCIDNTCPNPTNQRIDLCASAGDIFCYCLCAVAPTAGSSAMSRFKITGVTGSVGYVPLISPSNNSDSISIATAPVPKQVCLSMSGSSTNPTVRCGNIRVSPSMVSGECFDITLNIGLSSVVFNAPACLAASCACICVTRNGIMKGSSNISNTVTNCCSVNITLTGVTLSDVIFYKACGQLTTYNSVGGIACGTLNIGTVTSCVGSFIESATNYFRSASANC